MSIEGDVKEPMALFDKSRAQSSRCHALSDCAAIRLGGWWRGEIIHGLKRLQCGPLFADMRSHVSGPSAI